jgi:hypothetical protein
MHQQQSPSHQRKEAEVVEEEGAAAGEVAAAEEAVEIAVAVPEEALESERPLFQFSRQHRWHER